VGGGQSPTFGDGGYLATKLDERCHYLVESLAGGVVI